jgi:hypothetical protein
MESAIEDMEKSYSTEWMQKSLRGDGKERKLQMQIFSCIKIVAQILRSLSGCMKGFLPYQSACI